MRERRSGERGLPPPPPLTLLRGWGESPDAIWCRGRGVNSRCLSLPADTPSPPPSHRSPPPPPLCNTRLPLPTHPYSSCLSPFPSARPYLTYSTRAPPPFSRAPPPPPRPVQASHFLARVYTHTHVSCHDGKLCLSRGYQGVRIRTLCTRTERAALKMGVKGSNWVLGLTFRLSSRVARVVGSLDFFFFLSFVFFFLWTTTGCLLFWTLEYREAGIVISIFEVIYSLFGWLFLYGCYWRYHWWLILWVVERKRFLWLPIILLNYLLFEVIIGFTAGGCFLRALER